MTHILKLNDNLSAKQKIDRKNIDRKREILISVSNQLKTEFFGIDNIIDKVISAIQAWYIFPELITRPVIVCLWGMTGVGKTQLVRRLVALLEFQEKFVEVQMDGGSVGTNHSFNSLTFFHRRRRARNCSFG
jgi:cell division protease FtsH